MRTLIYLVVSMSATDKQPFIYRAQSLSEACYRWEENKTARVFQYDLEAIKIAHNYEAGKNVYCSKSYEWRDDIMGPEWQEPRRSPRKKAR